ncbi:MAG: hypothetical protein JO250_14990 [Armatimonadetes bacterium]|nr:hypothetical protein [Armatimonadota bacterium]
MMTRGRAWLAWESMMLFGICLADMVSTLYWVHSHVATEENPWMALWLRHGDFAFCAMKLISFLPLLAVCAHYRPSRPRLVAVSLRGTITLYLLLYTAAVGVQYLGH